MLNSFHIIGRLGKDPELKQTPSGKSVCEFSVAINNGYKKDETLWINAVAWNKQAESVNEYLHKGSLVFISGSIQEDKWEDDKGNKRHLYRLQSNRVIFLDPKPESERADPKENDDLPF